MSAPNHLVIEPQGIYNGLLRVKISNGNRYRRLLDALSRHLGYVQFKLEYKTIIRSTESEWKSFVFLGSTHIYFRPEMHFNVRIATNLYDYDMKFKLSMMIMESLPFEHETLHKGQYHPPSNILEIKVPSLMKDASYDINDWIEFKSIEDRYWHSGIILDKMKKPELDDIDLTETEKYHYKIQYMDRNGDEQEIISDDKTQFRLLLVHGHIDLSNRAEADELLLVGKRMDVDDDTDIFGLYKLMTDIYSKDYGTKYMTGLYYHDFDFLSMGKSIALNVIDYLWIKDKEYKVKCPVREKHYEDTLQLMPQREWIVGLEQDAMFLCDLCLCQQGDYDWMYRCKKEKERKYCTHDLCMTCVYDMVKRYNQLSMLLHELLDDDLNEDCIQVIVTFTSGNVVKL